MAIKTKPLKNPKPIPNNRFPEKLQPMALIAFFVAIAPKDRVMAKITALANHNLKLSEAITEPNTAAKLSSKLTAAQTAIIQASNENNSDKNPLKKPYRVETPKVPMRIKSKIDTTSCDPKKLIGNITGKGKGIWKIIVVPEVLFGMNNYFCLSSFLFSQ